MAQIDSALEYLHDLGRGAKFNATRFDDIFYCLQSRAVRKGFSNEILKELVVLWLKLKIPVTKWSSLGYCLIPEGKIADDIVLEVIHWILKNRNDEECSFKVVAALNYLTGLLDYNLINRDIVDQYYDFFFFILDNEKYLIPASKLVYTFTKSNDVTRSKVVSILNCINKKKSSRHYNCLLALLNLFKSYWPEYVPEEIPMISVSVAFSKLNKLLSERLEQSQLRSNIQLNLSSQNKLTWWTAEYNVGNLKKQKQMHLVPDLEYLQLGAVIYTKNGKQKKCLQFSSIHNLMVHHFGNSIEIPANILSLLINDAGLHILQFSNPETQSRFSQTLYHTLHNNFLWSKPNLSYGEKKHFLQRVAALQTRLRQGIPVVSRFLAQYITTWNGTDFFDEILNLLEWISFKSFYELFDCILIHIETLFLTSCIMRRCSILDMLKKMYINIYDILTTKQKLLFLRQSNKIDLMDTLNNFSIFINDLCGKSLNTFPDSIVLRHSFLNFYEDIAEIQLESEHPLWTVLPMSLAYNVLCSFNGFTINRILGLFIKYKQIHDKIKSVYGKDQIKNQILLSENYSTDFVNCLWYGRAISWRTQGLLLKDLPDIVLHMMKGNAAEYDQLLDIRNHFAFAMHSLDFLELKNFNLNKDLLLTKIISPYFSNVSKFIETVAQTVNSSED